jgi:phage virion morphogenesis protein
MADSLQDLERLGAVLLERLSGPSRRKLLGAVAQALRAADAGRIAAQVNPDGSPFAPRKPQRPRERLAPGRLKRQAKAKAMFAKLRTRRYLKARATEDEASVGFEGRAAAIARVHHYGLRDRVVRTSPRQVRYPARQLVGFAPGDPAMLMDILLAHLDA